VRTTHLGGGVDTTPAIAFVLAPERTDSHVLLNALFLVLLIVLLPGLLTRSGSVARTVK
jgi:hypothetical protein